MSSSPGAAANTAAPRRTQVATPKGSIRPTRVVEQHVLNFEVAVHETSLRQVLESVRQVQRDLQALIVSQWLLFEFALAL